MKIKKYLIVFILCLLIVPIVSNAKITQVKKILSGNTFVTEANEKIQLRGVKIAKQNKCYAKQSKKQLSRLIRNKKISIKILNKKNKRFKLAYVYLGKKSINKKMQEKTKALMNKCQDTEKENNDSDAVNNSKIEIPKDFDGDGVNSNEDCDDYDKTLSKYQYYYLDNDYDGYGDAVKNKELCANSAPFGYANNNTDCNDNDGAVHENQIYYADNDDDGYGSSSEDISICSSESPTDYVTNNSDLDDSDYFNGNNPTCGSDIYNCSNFSIQSAAQAVYDYCAAQGYGDIHRLDADNNGMACESLL
ncbi:hypothetical protein A2335_02980 [Candidatus Peregrinibacteria bacterium RIFOXYB2_FULL_32_7]|nr:MAG: hypothetical protein A2335_02980 [Candidatus Peregrinibacteria bacterium RIFOXYB2_FULL_32_7]OGY87423.1 MAG: hypothetical protein A2233_00715 [Candidatus Kerfeldbacteria bacterium RIFOXYA2_FULL_38_24]